MKTISNLLLALFCAVFAVSAAFAQAPQAFSYQAIANTANGAPVVNGSVKVRISILDNTATGAVLYTETHAKTTNAQGLFNLNIGQGTVAAGTFASINWAVNSKFVKVELDPAGGTNYTTVGTSQLLSVPYAMYAGSAGNAGQWATNANNRLAYNSGDVEIGQANSGLWLTSPNGTKYKISVNDNGQLSLPTSTTTGNTPAQLYMYGSFNNWDANTALQMSFVAGVSPTPYYSFKGFKYLTAGTTYKFLPALGSTTPYGAGSNNTLATNGNAFTVPSDGFYQIEVGYSSLSNVMTLYLGQASVRPSDSNGFLIVNSSAYNTSTNIFTASVNVLDNVNIYFGLIGVSSYVAVGFDDVLQDGTFEMRPYELTPAMNIPISTGAHTITCKMNFNGTGIYTIN